MLKKHMLYYKSANLDKEYGMDLYEELPASRKRTVANTQNTWHSLS